MLVCNDSSIGISTLGIRLTRIVDDIGKSTCHHTHCHLYESCRSLVWSSRVVNADCHKRLGQPRNS